MKPLSIFTEKYNKKVDRLINSVILSDFQGNELPAIAQWDTGATGTCISHRVVSSLNIAPFGFQIIQTPSGMMQAEMYKINLTLNNEVVVNNLTVWDSEIGNQGIDVLIGMDVIGFGDFAISNFNGETQFTFRVPSLEHIDFTEEQ